MYLKNYQENPEDIISEIVEVSNRSCDLNYSYCDEFIDRYLATEDLNDITNFSFKKYPVLSERPFVIICKKVMEDKKEIIDYLKIHERFNPCSIAWNNELYNEIN